MGLIGWLVNRLGRPVTLNDAEASKLFEEYAGDICIREMAFWAATNTIANAISKCEFKTFVDGKETKGPEYYLWNVSPNLNQNSSGFLHKLVRHLYRKNEALVIAQNGQLLVVDSFTRRPYALFDDLFEQVTVGDFTFAKTFNQSEVLYWQLSEVDMRQVTNRLYESYSKLIGYAMKAYQRSRGTKGIFEYGTLPIAGTPQREAFNKLINESFATWLNSDAAALPLGEGQKFTELAHKTYSNESTRDIRAQIDDVSDFTAKAFGIPPALLRGDVQGTSDAVDQFLTFCIDPLCDMLQEEINRKRSGQAAYLAGTYVQIDTKAIKHIDLLNVATSVDKLIGSGAFSVNDIRKVVGEAVINEDWANAHYITKNYTPFDEALQAAARKGGG